MSELDYEIIDLDTLSLGEGSEPIDIESDVAVIEEENEEILRERALATMDNNRREQDGHNGQNTTLGDSMYFNFLGNLISMILHEWCQSHRFILIFKQVVSI